MIETNFPWISLMIVSLPIGSILMWLLPSRHARLVALMTALFDLVLSLSLLFRFDVSNPGFQFVERHDWIPTLNIEYTVGVDGMSVLFLPLTVLLFIAVVVASWNSIRTMPRLFFTLLLILESVTLGIFCSLDTILFFLFWEATLIPLYFLISLWGIGPHRRYAAVKYTMFMLAGGVPLLFGFLLLAFDQAGMSGGVPAGLVFDYVTLLNNPVPGELQTLVFFLLFIGFAVKTPLFPFHTWLPTVAMEGPVAIAALMTGLKLGAYGLIRFAVPLAPEAAVEYHWLLAGLGVTGILYGAVLALSQSNLRRMLAYSSISHVGLVVLGIASFNLQGIQGALFQLINFTIVAGGIFLVTGYLHHRVGSTDMVSIGGVARTMPLLTTFFFLFGLAAMGVPGTNGFPAEFLILVSALKTHTGAGLAALFGVVIGAAYFLSYYRRAFLGPVLSNVVVDALDIRGMELLIVAVLALLVIALGLYPAAVLDLTEAASKNWLGFFS
ncbi:MAG: NADH-quinone oxidoreductase subunit M [Candidatus Thiodiazotropha sp. (ex Ctena orbiculata)]|nr:NADH-quinone oxidoreductase subunit M [Candidatus Thiodiazotropha taylori]MBT2996183.1 NADH-quinone oxidoreductase subunit M [Candidatus Thiodiazotropha taylori]MBT2999672.1 NADH-quinone oxidoreductase subunit M [Candidatus Thiodiazotropha taylori]MBV2106316.1 NADH-quinone oxidoreductase subunit M [Candidatus Thiodiazotropha taylori]MBV2110448.1 NADH-quinone oxidoreductase subunit M [Candidatus Thiodiazotropha taylori]